MDYSTLQPGLVAWIKSLTGLAVVVWEDEPRPWSPGVLALLSWVSSAPVGVDETRWEADDSVGIPGANLTQTLVGCRTLTLQIAIETLNQLPGTPNARSIVEQKIRDRLYRVSSLAALQSLNVGLQGTDNVTQADYEADDRWISRALFTVRFNATSFDRDSDNAIGSIETVGVTSHISNPAGTQEPADLQMTQEVLP